MDMSITSVGLQAIANAEAGGFKLKITKFAVSQYTDDGSHPHAITDTDLFGTPIYSGGIDTIEVIPAVDAGVIRISVSIPIGQPSAGSWNVTECAFYLDSGECFAVGYVDPAYTKPTNVALRFLAIIAAGRLGDVIDVTVSQLCNVPGIAVVPQTPDPTTYPWNAIAILNQNRNPNHTDSSGMAVRYGPGSDRWGFLGYDLMFNGAVEKIIDNENFVLHPEKNGFHFQKFEIGIMQIVSGSGRGESRRIQYLGGNNWTEYDNIPFTTLDLTSQVNLWRSASANRVFPLTTPSAGAVINIDGNGGSSYDLGLTPQDDSYIIPFWDGIEYYGDYTVSGSTLLLNDPLPAGEFLDIYPILLDGTNRNETGTIIVPKTTKFISDGLERYYTPAVGTIVDQNHTIVTFGGIRQRFDSYTISGNRVVLNIAPKEGVAVYLTVLDVEAAPNQNLQMRRTFTKITTPTIEVYDSGDVRNVADNVLVFLGDLQSASYQVGAQSVYLQSDNDPDSPPMLWGNPPAGGFNAAVIEFNNQLEVDMQLSCYYASTRIGNILRFFKTDGTHDDIDLTGIGGGTGSNNGVKTISGTLSNTNVGGTSASVTVPIPAGYQASECTFFWTATFTFTPNSGTAVTQTLTGTSQNVTGSTNNNAPGTSNLSVTYMVVGNH